MAKLCPRGKAAAKRKSKVYPSAYANMYASAVCSGKVYTRWQKNRKRKMGGGMAQRGLGRAFMKGEYNVFYKTKEKKMQLENLKSTIKGKWRIKLFHVK